MIQQTKNIRDKLPGDTFVHFPIMLIISVKISFEALILLDRLLFPLFQLLIIRPLFIDDLALFLVRFWSILFNCVMKSKENLTFKWQKKE